MRTGEKSVSLLRRVVFESLDENVFCEIRGRRVTLHGGRGFMEGLNVIWNVGRCVGGE